MTYTTLPGLYRGLLLAFTTLILIFCIHCIIRMCFIMEKKRHLASTCLVTLITFVIYQGMIMYQQEDLPAFDIPVIVLLPVLILLTACVMILQYRAFKWQSENLSSMSVKEAIDKLPTGIACYTDGGIPIMVNEKMHLISKGLTGQPVTDADVFWGRLQYDISAKIISKKDHVIVNEASKHAYSVSRKPLSVNGVELFELTAVDVSREYELVKELEVQRNRESMINKRLKALMETIEFVTMNRELLGLKSALHDNIGQSILIAKRYLYAPDSVDKKKMLDLWQGNIMHLVSDEIEEWELPYYVISKEADMLGIHLEIIGSLPPERKLIPVVDNAISVQIGNTLRHTDATTLTVTVTEKPDNYRICLSNGSSAPDKKPTEKGGLSNLRREVESVGGTMEIKTVPDFRVEIVLPRGDVDYE